MLGVCMKKEPQLVVGELHMCVQALAYKLLAKCDLGSPMQPTPDQVILEFRVISSGTS